MLLVIGGLVGVVALLPYALALNPPQLPPGSPPLALLLALNVFQSLVLIAVAAGVGLWLGPRVGLGAPLLEVWLRGDTDAPRRFRAQIIPSALASSIASAGVLLLEVVVFVPRLPQDVGAARAAAAQLWQALLASVYGGITEEILFTALAFGLGHLPATAALVALTPLVVVRAIVLNGLAGVAFGWLYWRRGLLAAMVAHVAADLVLHVVSPAVLGRG